MCLVLQRIDYFFSPPADLEKKKKGKKKKGSKGSPHFHIYTESKCRASAFLPRRSRCQRQTKLLLQFLGAREHVDPTRSQELQVRFAHMARTYAYYEYVYLARALYLIVTKYSGGAK